MNTKMLLAGVGAAIAVISAALLNIRATAQTSRAQIPMFEPDPLWSEALPNKWVTGQVGGVAVDSHDNVWVFHRPATIPDGEKAAALNPLRRSAAFQRRRSWNSLRTENSSRRGAARARGTSGRAPSTESSSTPKDNVWLSGSAKDDNQILKFTSKGKFLMQIGHAGKNQGSNDTNNLGGPAGLFVYQKTNELFVADGYFNHRVIVFDADTGAYKRHWGRTEETR